MDEEQDIKQLLHRFHQYQKGKDSGYFDIEELSSMVQYYSQTPGGKEVCELAFLAQKLHPNNIGTLKIKALSHIYYNEPREALQLLNQLNTNDIETLMIKITTMLSLKQKSEVRSLTEHLLERRVLTPDMVCDISKCFPPTNNERLGLEFLKKSEKYFPGNPDIVFLIGEFHELLGNNKQAEKIYLKLVDSDPFDSEAWFNLASLYTKMQKFDKALEAINYSLATDPHDQLAIQVKADILSLSGQNKKAIRTLLDALKEGANAYDIYNSIGRNYIILDEYEKALDWFNKADAKRPDTAVTFLNRFDAYVGMRQFEQAYNELERLSTTDVPVCVIWERKGLLENMIGQFEAARNSYRKALRDLPNNPYLWAKLSMVEWELGNYKATKRCINKALDIDNEFWYGYMVLAAADFKLHQYRNLLEIIGSPAFMTDPNKHIFFELCPETEPNFTQIIDALRQKKDIDHLLVAPRIDTTD